MKKKNAAGSADMLFFYVSLQGNDRWSGRLPEPNSEHKDGPFATITRARDTIRKLKRAGKIACPVTVRVRGGKYYLPGTVVFTPEDSGTAKYPISYESYPGETAVLSGGVKITGWSLFKGGIYKAYLPDVKKGTWYFRSLFADGRRQIRARYPNADRRNPFRGGFLYITETEEEGRRFFVRNIFNVGDELEYSINIPSDGYYDLWLLHSGSNKQFGFQNMGGRTSIRVDNERPTLLQNLADTDSPGNFLWSCCARMLLEQGRHTMTWRNEKGGQINIETFALCPEGARMPDKKQKPSRGKQPVLVKAAGFSRAKGNELLIWPSVNKVYSKTCFPFRPGDIKSSIAKEKDAEIHIFPGQGCRSYMEIVPIDRIDAKACKIHIRGKEATTLLTTGDRFFVENAFSELDSPEEWYLNKKIGMLYCLPKKKITDRSEIIAPRLGRIFDFKGSKNAPVEFMRIAGLTFCENDYSQDDNFAGWGMGSDGTVYMQETENCILENCCFINIGKYALYLSGGRNNSICGNDISFGAEGGIFAIGSPGNKISDNHIHHCGQVRKHIGGIVLYGADSSGNVVSHNLIHDISRYGITLKDPGCRNIIEYNHVFNTNLETFDTGAIEVTQQDKEFRSRGIIKYNLLHDNVGYSSDRGIDLFGAWGIYLDSYAGGYTVSHNITYKNSSGGIMLQGGKDNNVFNNIIVGDGYQAIVVKNFADNSTGLRFERNIVCLREGNLFGCGNISRKMLRCDKNLYFHLHHKPMNIFWWSRWQSGEWWTVNLEAWEKSGFDENSIVDDPLFAGQKKDNFRLKAGSPAFRLGFEPIDVKKMGLITKRKGRPSRPVFSDFDICARRCSDCKKHKVNLSPCRHMKPVIFSKK